MTPRSMDKTASRLAKRLKKYDEAVKWHSYRPHDINREADQHRAAAALADEVRRSLSSDSVSDGSKEKLGRFDHHPDPAIDFEIEVESLQARLFDAKGKISKPGTEPETVSAVLEDIDRAMSFRVGGDPSAVAAKDILRKLEQEAKAALDSGTGGQQPVAEWGYANTVGNLIAQLSTFDPLTPAYGAFHADTANGRQAHVRGLTVSRERVKGTAIETGNEEVPYSVVVWSSPTEPKAQVVSEEFRITLTPTRTGFRNADGSDGWVRLWVGETNRGQPMCLLSAMMFCEGVFEGMDYTPVDTSTLDILPATTAERIAAVNRLTAALNGDKP